MTVAGQRSAFVGRMKNINRKIMTCVLSALIFTESVQTVWAVTQSELQQQINENQNLLNNINSQLGELESQQEVIEEEICDMNAELVNLYTTIGVLEEEIGAKEDEIAAKEAEIDVAQEEYEAAVLDEQTQYEAMKKRIQFMYEQGDESYIALLLASESFGDMLDKVEYIEDVYAYDRKMLQTYQETKQKVADMKASLEAEKTALEEVKAGLEADRVELVNQEDYLNDLLAQKQAESDNYEAEIAAAQAEADAYKAQIAADNKKLEQLKEEERKRLAAQNSTSTTTVTSNAGSAATIEAAKSVVASSNGSDLQKQIATYACNFIGNPYVAGGTSLTNGADCSGFIFRIYADFGYKVARNSYSLRSQGTGVSYDEAKPGDIICYAGHVAMYIGSGKIVHASSAKTGIKVSNAQYREILAVRRVVD